MPALVELIRAARQLKSALDWAYACRELDDLDACTVELILGRLQSLDAALAAAEAAIAQMGGR